MNQTSNKIIKLIAVYARVSTAKQEEEGTIETQLSAVRDFIERNNYTVVQEYIDNGWSGDILARPQLDQLRQDAKQKRWEAVLIYDPDRLARRYSYQELIMDELREVGVEVIFVTVPSPKNNEDRIVHGMKGLFAEYERVKISERFRLGKMRKVREGNILVSEAPYGYIYIPKKDKVHGYYKINKEEAKVVKMIFNFVANEGLTIRGVVKKLQELKIGPRKSKRGVWNTSTLSHLLRNKTYIGEAYYGKSCAVVPERPFNVEKYRKIKKTSRKIRPEEEWVKVPVLPIIDRSLFMSAQELLRANFELSKRNRKNEYLLAGKMWCSCGNRRTGEGSQHGKHLYYRCTDRVHNFPLPPTCTESGINTKIADKLIWQKIVELMSSPKLMSMQIKRWLNEKQKEVSTSVVNVEVIKKEISKLKEEEERYTKAYGVGLISIEKLRGYTISLRDKICLFENQIRQTQEEKRINEATLPQKDEIEIFAKRAMETLHDLNFEAKNAIVRSVIDKVVGTQKELQVYGFIPVEINNNGSFCSIHRHCRSS